jgi:hypothetical protein
MGDSPNRLARRPKKSAAASPSAMVLMREMSCMETVRWRLRPQTRTPFFCCPAPPGDRTEAIDGHRPVRRAGSVLLAAVLPEDGDSRDDDHRPKICSQGDVRHRGFLLEAEAVAQPGNGDCARNPFASARVASCRPGANGPKAVTRRVRGGADRPNAGGMAKRGAPGPLDAPDKVG